MKRKILQIDEGEKDKDTQEMKVDSDEEVDELKRVITYTLEFLINMIKKELKELLVEIKEEAGGEYLDAVLKLEGLIDVYLQVIGK